MVDELAAVLNQLTSRDFGSIYNGATDAQRTTAVQGWRDFLRKTPASELCPADLSDSRRRGLRPHSRVVEGAIPDAATAKKRAELILKDWASAPLKATLSEGTWTVVSPTHCQEALPQNGRYCYGGGGVRLRKSDGVVVDIIPPRHLP